MVGGEVCEIYGSHSGNEEYKCLLNVTQSSLIDTYECFTGTYCLHTMDGNSRFIYNANMFITRSVVSCPRRQSSTRNMLPPYLEDESSSPSEMLVATYGIYLNARQL